MNIRKFFFDNRWTVGFVQNDMLSILRGDDLEIKWVDNPFKDKWFADPFILSVSKDRIVLLVEEFYDPINRGRISKIIIDRATLSIICIHPILELPTHLSFPAIIRKDNSIYIYPENSAAGDLKLYEYNVDTDECTLKQTICAEPLTDAIMTDLLGEPLIFSTHLPTQNGNVLSCYKRHSNAFIFDREYLFKNDVARNAGAWFEYGGKVYRPAQDCTVRYGGAMFLQEVQKNVNESLSFKNIRRIDVSNNSYNLGCHTFNHYAGVTVIDVNGYRRPKMAKLGMALAAFKRKFK